MFWIDSYADCYYMDNMDPYGSAGVGMGMPSLLPKSMKRQPVIRVKNVSISDVFTHQIIFQRVYSWKATTAFSNLGNLIESFYQFSRTVDDGGVRAISLLYFFPSHFRNCNFQFQCYNFRRSSRY